MARIHIATQSLDDWKSRLADPEKHWKRGRSAFEAAVAWERVRRTSSGLPTEIAALLSQHAELANPTLLIALAEHKVDLPHGGRPSQNDVWALIRCDAGLLSMAVEAKAGEDFDLTVGGWLAKREGASKKEQRLKFLLDILGLSDDVSTIRYQLLHRTASAVLEARRWQTNYAAMIVQSFKNPALEKKQAEQWEDFRQFCSVLGAACDGTNKLIQVRSATPVPLFIGWVASTPATDEEVSSLGTASNVAGLAYPVPAEKIGPTDPTSVCYTGTYTPRPPYGTDKAGKA